MQLLNFNSFIRYWENVCLLGSYRDLRLPEVGYKQAVTLLQDSTEFTLSASIRQELANSGTLIAFSQGVNRYNFRIIFSNLCMDNSKSDKRNHNVCDNYWRTWTAWNLAQVIHLFPCPSTESSNIPGIIQTGTWSK